MVLSPLVQGLLLGGFATSTLTAAVKALPQPKNNDDFYYWFFHFMQLETNVIATFFDKRAGLATLAPPSNPDPKE